MNGQNPISLILKNLLHPATIIGLIVSLAIPFLVYLAPNISHKETIRQLDLSLPLPLFMAQFIIFIALFIVLNKDFRDWVKSVLPEKSFSILAVVFAVAVAIFAGTQIEARHRVQSDESVFMAVAQNMFYNHESGTCNQGKFHDGQLQCTAKSNSFKTKGLSFLYYIGMPLFGSDLHWIFKAELLMLPLAFLLMFFAIVAWTRQSLLAFFASLLMALQPTVLFQFRAMSVEPLYIFLSALSLLVFKWAYDRNTVKHWILLALILAFFAQTRQETAFCLFAFIIFALPKILDRKSMKAPAFFVTLSIFSVPVLLTISYFQGFGFQGGEFEAHGHFFEDLAKNWEEMTKPLKENGELENPFLTYFNYLFAMGGVYLVFRAVYDLKHGKKFYLHTLVFLLLYHIQTYMILENVSGDFSIQINQRYSLVMLPSMAFVAALPIAHIVQAFTESAGGSNRRNVIIATIIVASIFTGWTFHYKKDFNNNIMYNRNHLTMEEHEIWNWLNEQPEKDRLFIYGRPWHFVGYGISSIHYDAARRMSEEDLVKLQDDYKGEVYYIRGLDCWDSHTYHKKAVEHRISSTCDIFEREMELEGVKNILITNNYWVQIAKFNGRRNYNPKNILSLGDVKFTPADSSAEKNGSLDIQVLRQEDKNKDSGWEFLVLLNGKILVQEPYTKGKGTLSIEESNLQPGFNQLRFLVRDLKKNKKIVDVSKFHFYAETGATPLVNLEIKNHRQDWGSLHKNESIEGHKLTIDSQVFDSGFGMHAASETVFDIGGKYRSFRTTFGLDDESLCSEGVSVQIIGDGKILAESPVFQSGKALTLTANTEGVQELTLKTIPKAGIDCSHVDFVNPVLIP